MNCEWCQQIARYLVTGKRRYKVCDDHLERAQKAAGLPRSTVSIELGLLDPGGAT